MSVKFTQDVPTLKFEDDGDLQRIERRRGHHGKRVLDWIELIAECGERDLSAVRHDLGQLSGPGDAEMDAAIAEAMVSLAVLQTLARRRREVGEVRHDA